MLLVQLVLFLGCIVCVAVILAPDVALLLNFQPANRRQRHWIDGALLVFFWFPRTGLQLRVLTHFFLSYAFLRPVAAILWLLDEWLYPEYRQVEIKAPIIIVSVPRAGTTSFHRTIALDEDQLVTPTMLELVLPF
jgi:hypothetical protein